MLFTSCSANYPLELPHLSCFHLCSVLTCLSLGNQSCVSTYNPPFTFIKTSVFPPMFYWFLVSGYALFSPVTAVDIVFFFRFLPIKALLFHWYSTKLYILHSLLLFTSVQDNKGFNCGRCKSKSMINNLPILQFTHICQIFQPRFMDCCGI